MTNTLKISFILSSIFSGILIAWNTLSSFFHGVGINYIALLGIIFSLAIIYCTDKIAFKRSKDIFFISCLFCVLELVVYFACEFGDMKLIGGIRVYQNIISSFGLLFIAYISFRFWGEFANKRFQFIEIILGNKVSNPKTKKKAKELSNGCLEEKPNKQNLNQNNKSMEEELEIIVSEDEE